MLSTNHLVRIFLLLFSLSCVTAFTGCHQSGEQAMYYIPNQFIGNVIIVFDQPNGKPAEYKEGKRVYRISPNGVLMTQFAPNHGWHSSDEYWYTDTRYNPQKLLRYIGKTSDADRMSIDTVCYNLEPITDSNTPRTHYIAFIVSPLQMADSIYELQSATIFKLSRRLSGAQ